MALSGHGQSEEDPGEAVSGFCQPRHRRQMACYYTVREARICRATTFRDDRDNDCGDDIPERIRMEIKRSRELVVLLTPESVNRPWVLLEVGAAWGWSKAIHITPILCHVDVDPIPGMIRSKKAIHINDCANLFAEVKRRVKKHNA